MDLFSEVKVWCDRMLYELGHQVSEHEQQHRRVKIVGRGRVTFLPGKKGFRESLKKRYRKHETGSQREKIFQIALIAHLNAGREQYKTAQDVGGRGNYSENQELEKWSHK